MANTKADTFYNLIKVSLKREFGIDTVEVKKQQDIATGKFTNKVRKITVLQGAHVDEKIHSVLLYLVNLFAMRNKLDTTLNDKNYLKDYLYEKYLDEEKNGTLPDDKIRADKLINAIDANFAQIQYFSLR